MLTMIFQKTKYYPVNIVAKEIIDMPFGREKDVVLYCENKNGFIGIKGCRLNKNKCYAGFSASRQPNHRQ